MMIQPIPLSVPAEYFAVPIALVFGCNILLGLWVQIFAKRDNSHIDTMWGLSFVIPNIALFIIRGINGTITPRMILISTPVFFWGVRLAIYIGRRHKREDYRYK